MQGSFTSIQVYRFHRLHFGVFALDGVILRTLSALSALSAALVGRPLALVGAVSRAASACARLAIDALADLVEGLVERLASGLDAGNIVGRQRGAHIGDLAFQF